jgi:hypothetical protein
MLGKVIGQIVGSLSPMNIELTLLDLISNPIITHINCFRLSLFDSIVYNSRCAFVIGLDWSGLLGMTHSFKSSV